MKRLSLSILFFKILFFIVFVLSSGALFAQVPVITSFAPGSGPAGTSVTIAGSNFSTTPSDNIVWFGAVQANVTVATATQLTVTVPSGATYQPFTVTVNGLTAYSGKPFIVTMSGLRIIDPLSFSTKVDFTAGTDPQGVAIGDIDGDGKPDIVVTNWSSDFVSVYRNISTSGSITSGSFEAKVDFTVGGNSPFVTLGDVDGDGKPDMVVACRTGNMVSVFRNISTPGSITAASFSAKVDFSAGSGPDGIAIGDIDGDGKPDLSVTNYNSNTISILKNTSTTGSISAASFAPKVDLITGLQPYYIALGDLDIDGKPDLVVSNYNSQSISIYRNISSSGSITSGSFDPRIDIITGSRPYGLAIGDIDGDNKPDINVVSTDNAVVSVFRNTSLPGSITIGSFAPKVDFATGTAPYIVVLNDINGDGRPDIIVQNYGAGTVSVLKNSSVPGTIASGSFSDKFDFAGGSSFGMAIGDLDSDGKPDIAVSNRMSSAVSVLHNEILERVLPVISSFSPVSGPIGTTVTITGTNFSTTPSDNTVWFGAVKATVTASTSTQLTVTVPTGATYQPITVTVTGLTAYSSSPFNVTIPGVNTFDLTSLAYKVDFTTGLSPSSVALADIDGDGKSDLIVTNTNVSSNRVTVYRNISTSGSVSPGSFSLGVDFIAGISPRGIAVGDIDGDGKLDLAIANLNGNSISILRNTSVPGSITTSSFSAKVDLITSSSPYGVIIGDIDGDGKPDLAVPDYMNSTVSVFRNNSEPGFITTGSFEARVDFPSGNYPNHVAIGDIDGDGKPDLAVTNWGSNSLSLLRNISSAGSITLSSFAGKVDFTTGTSPSQVAIADIDGDGKPDLTVTNSSGDSFSIFRNISTSGSLTLGSLALRSDFLLGPALGSRALAVGDVNGDGKPDLVIGNNIAASNMVYIFLNTSSIGIIGPGSLGSRLDFTAGTGVASFAVGDVDGDAKPDLVVANIEANSISVLRNKLSEPLPPGIASFSPLSGAVGTSVIISGTSFDTNPSNNIVWFGAVQAAVNAATATQLTVTVPAGATYQPITVTVNGLTGFSKAPFGITFPSARTIDASSFGTMVEFATGIAPWSVAVGDIDLDGKPDLAVVNPNSNSVTVYRNTSTSGSLSSGSFSSRVDLSTGNNPQHVAIGDLDGDGKPDLAVTNWADNTVSVFRNTSTTGSITSGSFASKVDFTTGLAPFKVCIGDLDCDGKPDIAVTNYSDGSVSVLRSRVVSGNINTDSFDSKVDFMTGINPYFASIGDIDGDGKPDLAVANFNSSTVSVFRNSSVPGFFGASSFSPKVDLFTGIGTIYPVIADIDGDGKHDLSVLNSHTSTVYIFRNISMPGSISSFSFEAKVDIMTTGNPHCFTFGDFDGDGKPDLAVTGGGIVSIHRNTSIAGSFNTNSFAAKVDVAQGDSNFEIAVCDFDGDSKPDFVVPNNTKNTISVFRNIIPEFAPGPPTITSFSPASGPIGSTVTISGTGFSPVLSDNIVKFGTQQAVITSASATQLTVIVPEGATTQPISVTVSMLSVNSVTNFTVTTPPSPPPSITNFNPSSGVVGTTVIINGSNFNTNISDNTVKFGSVQATVTSATATQLTVLVPSGAATSPVYVTVNGLTGYSNISFIVTVAPVITSFLPASGPIGTTVMINGNNFGSTPSDNAVMFGAIQAAVTSATTNQLSVIVPVGATDQSIYVTANGLTGSSSTNFTVTTSVSDPPVITSYSPAAGQIGTTVTISGSNFSSNIIENTVKFGNVQAFILTATTEQITVNVPLGATSQPVYVTVNGLTGYTNSSFIVTIPPIVMSFSPTTGPVGTSVTIFGNNFGPSPSDNIVMFGPVQAVVSTATLTQLTVIVPAGTTSQPIAVSVNGLIATSSTPFMIIIPPGIASFSPLSGTVGTTVTITGSDFSSNISENIVKFGNVQAAVISSATNQLAVIVPSGSTSQPINITVNGLTATSSISFIVNYPPNINSFNPQSGPVGTSVTILGSNFSSTSSNNNVRFGTVQATVISATETQITVTVPEGANTQPISVTVNDLTTYTTSPFNVPPQQPPGIISFTPTSGPVGTTVTISGSNFSTATENNTVWFGGAQATVTVATPTQLTVTVPEGEGNQPITVTVNGLTGNSNSPFNISSPGENPSTGSVEFESSVLTLNGDGINERLVIKNFETYGKCKLSVYNSRGVLIYSNKDYMNDWDTMIDNHVLDAGGYFYVLETDIGVFRGSFSILS